MRPENKEVGICSQCQVQYKKVIAGHSKHINQLQKVNVNLTQKNLKLVSAIKKGIKEGHILNFPELSDALLDMGAPFIVEKVAAVAEKKEVKQKTWQELKQEWNFQPHEARK